MEWLVQIEVGWPAGADPATRDRLQREEGEHVRQLLVDGRIVRLWRVPGRWASWSIWAARDAAELHESLAALPLWSWMSVQVHPLAQHPLERAAG